MQPLCRVLVAGSLSAEPVGWRHPFAEILRKSGSGWWKKTNNDSRGRLIDVVKHCFDWLLDERCSASTVRVYTEERHHLE